MGERLKHIFRRKKKLINPRYQLKTAALVSIPFLLYSFILGFIVFFPLFLEFSSAVDIKEQARLSEEILSLHKRLWPAIFTVATLLFIHIIWRTHRIAGPFYRFKAALEEFLKGNFKERIHLRKGDEFREIEPLVNNLAEYLEEARNKDAEIEKKLETIVELLKKDAKTEDCRRLAEDALKILKDVKKL